MMGSRRGARPASGSWAVVWAGLALVVACGPSQPPATAEDVASLRAETERLSGFLERLEASTSAMERALDRADDDLPQLGTALLTVESALPAQVYVNSKLAAEQTPLVDLRVTPGPLTVRVYYPERKTFSATKRITLNDGEAGLLVFPNL